MTPDYLGERMSTLRADAIRNADTPRWASVVVRHPVLAALVILVIVFGFHQIVGRMVLRGLDDGTVYSTQLGELVGETLSVLLVVAIILALGWWRSVGLAGPVAKGAMRFAWFPTLIVVVLFMLQLMQSPLTDDAKWLGLGIPNVFMIGFFEEALTRGLVLLPMLIAWQSRPSGVMRAVMISSFLFGIAHLLNLFGGAALAPTLIQVGYAFGFGVGFAALLLRTNTMWIGIVLHALVDANSGAWFGPPADGGTDDGSASIAPLLLVGLPLLVYGIILIRKREQ
ncbi:CPBP family intramembrane glutamic endopeptidase [Glycomyces sp. NPDC047010]|uniref:CPBP family intramembrane glutamic endopeptidase n=1 Tax=Glycomyces sp. NPDC047010 TaxID=3155023 RepID=UPI00340311E2